MTRLAVAAGAAAFTFAFTQIAPAADMPRKAPITPAPMVAPYSWTGFYVGANVGYGWSDQDIRLTGDPIFVQSGFIDRSGVHGIAGDLSGILGGVQIGYNWQAGQFVLGAEADFDAADISSDQNVGFIVGVPRTFHGDQKVKWLSTVRGRLGFTPVDRLLVYATGGLAVGDVNAQASLTTNAGCTVGICLGGSASKTMTGWTVGGGLEYATWGNWSVKGEYLYYRLDSIDITGRDLTPGFAPNFPTINGTVDIRGNIVRVGLNYKFY